MTTDWEKLIASVIVYISIRLEKTCFALCTSVRKISNSSFILYNLLCIYTFTSFSHESNLYSTFVIHEFIRWLHFNFRYILSFSFFFGFDNNRRVISGDSSICQLFFFFYFIRYIRHMFDVCSSRIVISDAKAFNVTKIHNKVITGVYISQPIISNNLVREIEANKTCALLAMLEIFFFYIYAGYVMALKS